MSLIFNISAAAARVASACMAKNGIRYYLNGILVEPRAEGGAYIVGTSGSMMAVVIDKSATISRTVITSIPDDLRREMPRMSAFDDSDKPTGTRLILRAGSGRSEQVMTVTTGKNISRIDQFLIDGTFPDWRRALPSSECPLTEVRHKFNLALIAKLCKGLDTNHQLPSRIYRADTSLHGTYLLNIEGFANCIFVVMPMADQAKASEKATQATLKLIASAKTSVPWRPPAPSLLTEDPDHVVEVEAA